MTVSLAVGVLAVFLFGAIGTPIGFSLIIGATTYLFMAGLDPALAGEQMIQGLFDGFVLLAVPLFIIAANIMNAGSISDRLLQFCVALVGRFKGGLGHVNIFASLIFSGMSGSAVADAAGIGKIIIDMMVKSGKYSRGYAAAITAASATIGPIIPPSIPMVLYSLVSNTSIGYLFLGGILPGFFMGAVLMVMNTIIAHKNNIERDEIVKLRQIPRLTVRAFPALLMPLILLVGIYGGVTTPTEAASVAAFYALIVAVFLYRALSWRGFYQILLTSVRSSASVGLVIGGALIFNYIIANENIPSLMAGSLVGLEINPLIFLFMVNLLLLILGCFLDAATLILVIVPLFLPTCRILGIDLVHFGVVSIINIMIGLITPPYGILLFVINGVTGIPLGEIVRNVLPFLAILILALVVLIVFPDLVLWLPQQFGYRG